MNNYPVEPQDPPSLNPRIELDRNIEIGSVYPRIEQDKKIGIGSSYTRIGYEYWNMFFKH